MQKSKTPPTVSRLTRLSEQDIRKIWPREEQDFSPWIKDSVDELNSELGLEIQFDEAEGPVGNFRLDLAGMDSLTRKPVVVENQIGRSDHDHLGKLLTYAAGREAGVLIWVATEFQEPHRAALGWLNTVTGPDLVFYGVQFEVFRIGDSKPAPKFTMVVGPVGEKRPKPAATDDTPRGRAYRDFSTKFLQHVREKHPGLTRSKTPNANNYFFTGIGFGSFSIGYTFDVNGQFRVELYIDSGNKEQNQRLFAGLKGSQAAIDKALGATLVWDEMPDKLAYRAYLPRDGNIDDSSEKLEEYIAWGAREMARFKEVFRPLLAQLPT